MNAVTIMFLALVVALVGRWAHNMPTASVKSVVGALFVLIFVAALDHGELSPIARGLAWLFFVAVILSNNSPLTGIANIVNGTKNKGGGDGSGLRGA